MNLSDSQKKTAMDSKKRVLAAFSPDQTPDRVPWVEQQVNSKVISKILGREVTDPIEQGGTDYRAIYEYHLRAAGVYVELGLDGIACPAWTPSIADPVVVDNKVLERESQPGILDWDSFHKRTKELPRPGVMPFTQQIKPWSDAMSKNKMFHILAVGMQYRMLEVSVGFENIAIWSVEQPELLHACAKFFCDWTCEAIKIILDQNPLDAVWLDDDLAFKTNTFISPAMLREFVFPYHRQIVKTVGSYGLPTMFHSDGNLARILDDLIESGFVAIHPLERLAFDIRSARKELGDRITLIGNVDIDFLERGEPERCYQEASSLIRELGPKRFILSSGNSITANVRAENLKQMSRAVLEQKIRE